jgi:uncharacterized membrane protein
MSEDRPEFRSGVVRPVECLSSGWRLVKDDYWLFLGITAVGTLIASAVPLGILAGPMMCGIYYCLLRRARGRDVKFEMLFRGFDQFVPSLIATLIMMVPLLLVIVPSYAIVIGVIFANMPAPAPGAAPPPSAAGTILAAYGVFFAVVLAVSVAVSVVFFFTYPLIMDRKLSGVEAIKTSFRAVSANLGGVIGLVLLNMLLTLVGYAACCVGLFFVLPVHFAANAVAYREVFGEDAPPDRPADGVEADYDDRPDLEPRGPTG